MDYLLSREFDANVNECNRKVKRSEHLARLIGIVFVSVEHYLPE